MNKDFVYKRRLLKLADYGDTIKPARFNFSQFAGSDWKGKPDLSCGTAACLFGHSSTIPSFRRLGLHMYRIYGSSHPWVGLKGGPTGYAGTVEAGRKIFDLSIEEFEFLFIPSDHLSDDSSLSLYGQEDKFGFTSLHSSSTAKQVSAQIRRFVEWKYGK
jgi:hypothetical protein